MGQARAGFVNGLHVGQLLQRHGAPFVGVELREQLRQQVVVPYQRRRQGMNRIEHENQAAVAELPAAAIRDAKASRAAPGGPFPPLYPGQLLGNLGAGLLDECFRVFLAQGQIRQRFQPLLDGQANRQEVAGNHAADTRNSRARICRQAQQKQHDPGRQERFQHGLYIAAAEQQHGREAAQQQNSQQQHDEQAVNKIDHLARAFLLRCPRQQGHGHQDQGQGRLAEPDDGLRRPRQRHRNRYRHQHQRHDQESQRQKVKEAGSARAEQQYLAADDAGQDHDPDKHHPALQKYAGKEHHARQSQQRRPR